jgi:hypothetical protein
MFINYKDEMIEFIWTKNVTQYIIKFQTKETWYILLYLNDHYTNIMVPLEEKQLATHHNLTLNSRYEVYCTNLR